MVDTKNEFNRRGAWGLHCVLDMKRGNIEKITSAEAIGIFAQELCKVIDMKPFGEPIVIHFGSDNLMGFSLVQLIETSLISGHFVDQNGDGYIDIFSCKAYDPEVAYEFCKQYFKFEDGTIRVMFRE